MSNKDRKIWIILTVVLLVGGYAFSITSSQAGTYNLIKDCSSDVPKEKVDDQIILCLDAIENELDDLNVRMQIMVKQLHDRGYYDG